MYEEHIFPFCGGVVPLQVAAGTHFIKSTLSAFHVPSVKTLVMMDVYAYDGFPALTCVEEIMVQIQVQTGTPP